MNIGDDIIDSRDIQERINELESEWESLKSYVEEAEDDDEKDEAEINLEVFMDDEYKELEMLQEMKDDVGSSEWNYGIAFILNSYFEEYAEEFAEDIGAIDRNATWPLNHIDWEAACRELQMDYSVVTVDGNDYWYQS